LTISMELALHTLIGQTGLGRIVQGWMSVITRLPLLSSLHRPACQDGRQQVFLLRRRSIQFLHYRFKRSKETKQKARDERLKLYPRQTLRSQSEPQTPLSQTETPVKQTLLMATPTIWPTLLICSASPNSTDEIV
jgi:hypothetical protein